MIGRLAATGENVRQIAARIFPEIAAERLTPRAVTDLFTDPLDLATALFASQLVDAADVVPTETPATHASRWQPLSSLGERRPGATITTSHSAIESARSTSLAAPTQTSSIASVFGAVHASTQERPKRLLLRSPTDRGESRLAHGAPAADRAIAENGLSPVGPSQHRSVGAAPVSFPPRSTRVVRSEPIERAAAAIPDASSDRLRAALPVAARTAAWELASGPPAGAFTQGRTAAHDESVTRWVQGAAGLATLFAPLKPAAPTTPSGTVVATPAASEPGVALDNATTQPVPAPAPPASWTQSASGDVELLMDELERRLELEYLRHYGISGR